MLDPDEEPISIRDFKPGHQLAERDKPVTLWSYICVVLFSAAVCAGIAYLIGLFALRGMGRAYSRGSEELVASMESVPVEAYLAAPGVLGGTLGAVIGLGICVKIWKDERDKWG